MGEASSKGSFGPQEVSGTLGGAAPLREAGGAGPHKKCDVSLPHIQP